MKIRTFLIALLLTPLLLAHAQQEIKATSLVGTWRYSEPHPSGTMITAIVRFDADQKFTSSGLANDKVFMNARGTWALDASKLQWKYEYSSSPAIAPGFIDNDEVASVSDTQLSLKSGTSGKVHAWQRVAAPAAE